MMDYSITQVLHDLLKKRQLIKEIAKRMGMKYPTLAGKLNGTYAKLSADEFLPLCMAIREAGYEKELDGILHEYFTRLKGEVSWKPEGEDLVALTLSLYTGMGMLADHVARLSATNDTKEMIRLRNRISQDMFPNLVKMGKILDDKLAKSRKQTASELRARFFQAEKTTGEIENVS